jgi:hypothetical protein
VALSADATEASGFAKPLTFKRGTARLFGDVGATRFDLAEEPEARVSYLRGSAAGEVVHSSVTPHAVVLPRRIAQGSSELRPLRPADAVTQVMVHRFGRTTSSPDPFAAVVQLVQRCPVHVLHVRDPNDAVALADAVWNAPPTTGLAVEWFPNWIDAGSGVSLAAGVRGVRIGSDAVFWNEVHRTLDQVTSWPLLLTPLLDGTSSAEQAADAVARGYADPAGARNLTLQLLQRLVDLNVVVSNT